MQQIIEACKGIHPPRPEVWHDDVAKKIAAAIVNTLNLDNLRWTPDEKADRVLALQQLIISHYGKLWPIVRALDARQWGCEDAWDRHGLIEHLGHVWERTVDKVLAEARRHWKERYQI